MLPSAFWVAFLIIFNVTCNGIQADEESKIDSKEVMNKTENKELLDKSFNFQLSIKKGYSSPIHFHDSADYDSPEHYHSSLSSHYDHHSPSQYYHASSHHSSNQNYHHSSQSYHGGGEYSSVAKEHDHYGSNQQSYNQNSEHTSNQNYHQASSEHVKEKPVIHQHNTHIHSVNFHVNAKPPAQIESYEGAIDVKNVSFSGYTQSDSKEQYSGHESGSKEQYSGHESGSKEQYSEHESGSKEQYSEHHSPVVKIEHQIQVPIIQTEVKIPIVQHNLHHGLAILKQHRKQYLQQKKDLIHSLRHPVQATKQISLQLAVPTLHVDYGTYGYQEGAHSSDFGHYSAGFKSSGDLPPQILPASKGSQQEEPSAVLPPQVLPSSRSSQSDEPTAHLPLQVLPGSESSRNEASSVPLSRKKRTIKLKKEKLDDALFNHIMTKYLHHGTPLHIHEHQQQHSTTRKRQLGHVSVRHGGYSRRNRPGARRHQQRLRVEYRMVLPATGKTKSNSETGKKIDLHLGLPALNLILHISPVHANLTGAFLLQPVTELTNFPAEYDVDPREISTTPTAFSQLSEPAHWLFLNTTKQKQVTQYEVHEETNVSKISFEASTQSPSIIHFLIPPKLERQKTEVTYATEITTQPIGWGNERTLSEVTTEKQPESGGIVWDEANLKNSQVPLFSKATTEKETKNVEVINESQEERGKGEAAAENARKSWEQVLLVPAIEGREKIVLRDATTEKVPDNNKVIEDSQGKRGLIENEAKGWEQLLFIPAIESTGEKIALSDAATENSRVIEELQEKENSGDVKSDTDNVPENEGHDWKQPLYVPGIEASQEKTLDESATQQISESGDDIVWDEPLDAQEDKTSQERGIWLEESSEKSKNIKSDLFPGLLERFRTHENSALPKPPSNQEEFSGINLFSDIETGQQEAPGEAEHKNDNENTEVTHTQDDSTISGNEEETLEERTAAENEGTTESESNAQEQNESAEVNTEEYSEVLERSNYDEEPNGFDEEATETSGERSEFDQELATEAIDEEVSDQNGDEILEELAIPDQELTSSNYSISNDSSIRDSRLIYPDEMYDPDQSSLELPPYLSKPGTLRSDLPEDYDSTDPLLPVIPVIIQDLQQGRVSQKDSRVLSQIFGPRWADIKMQAEKESVDVNSDPQRVERSLDVPEGGEQMPRSADYLEVLGDYFEERLREPEPREYYAYEDDVEYQDGPDVSELLDVAQNHRKWKTHKAVPST